MQAKTAAWRPCGKGRWLLLMLLVLSACQGQPMPGEMIGTWVTDNDRYQDCRLQIGADRMVFVDREQGSDIGVIQKISTETKGGTRAVTIDYVNSQKALFTVELIYSSENGGSLWFKNQPAVVWKRPL